jgi:SAM-dependent methyltransferase
LSATDAGLAPLVAGGGALLGAVAQLAAAFDEHLVGGDEMFGEHSLWRRRISELSEWVARRLDELLADDSIAADLLNLIRQHGTRPTTVLDLGCGTGRLLAELHDHGIPGTGIDLQPHLITWARSTHPQLGLHVGDLRTARLGTTFDLVTCVGNTLSYLHTDTELAATFDTIRAHSHPGTLLAIATLTGAGRDVHGHSEITTSLGTASVTTESTWDPNTQIQTTTRTWQFTTGRVEQDTMRRRFWNPGLRRPTRQGSRVRGRPREHEQPQPLRTQPVTRRKPGPDAQLVACHAALTG